MKRVIEHAMFVYGCAAVIASMLTILFQVNVGLATASSEPPRVVIVLHVFALGLTALRFPGLPPFWAPVLRVSKARIDWTRRLLALSATFTALTTVVSAACLRTGEEPCASDGLQLFILSSALLTSVYMAVHWAFRPENIFSRGFLQFIRNPLIYFTGPSSRG